MKLKKIVSLALAGVLAVSMLAGCATKAPTQDDNKNETETAGISKEVGAMIEDVPAYVTFEDSSALDAALKKAVEYAGVIDVMPGYVYCDKLENVQADVYNKLGIKNTAELATIGTQETLAEIEKNAGAAYTLEDGVATSMSVVSAAIGENAVKAMIAEQIEGLGIKGYNYSVVEQNGTVGGNFNYTYTVSVSTCTKAVNSSVNGSWDTTSGQFQGAATPSVTFVAVQVVRTATHQ